MTEKALPEITRIQQRNIAMHVRTPGSGIMVIVDGAILFTKYETLPSRRTNLSSR
jgi:hypothetical protein